MVQLKTDGLLIAVYRVSTAPTSTTNMTGFLIWTRGSSFLNASGVDFHSILGSRSPPPIARPFAASDFPRSAAVCGLVEIAISVQSFCEWAQGERGEVGQADKDEDHADHHADKERRSGVERARALGRLALSSQRSGEAKREYLGRESAEE